MLESLITSKTRLRLLVKFFVNAANRGHMRGLAGEFNESTNSIRKELNNLTEAGYLEKRAVGTRIEYGANTQHPLFKPLQTIVRKYLGLDTIVEKILSKMGDVRQVWLVGDYAQGVDSGFIQVVIVGRDLDQDYAASLSPKIELLIERNVSFEWRECSAEEMDSSRGLLLYENDFIEINNK